MGYRTERKQIIDEYKATEPGEFTGREFIEWVRALGRDRIRAASAPGAWAWTAFDDRVLRSLRGRKDLIARKAQYRGSLWHWRFTFVEEE